ncbi:hypothetical protein BHK98_02510 [Hornefia porci]|uniref:HTH cro/C1-type domain-containing protein n=1 Tax=Hornefia porci TaxID=2652292 RepID=A0A1Q9JFR3_9FIRM|nr:hypothetical protein [Hornefia porci]OLR55035.1 hypothetical protein BHK98_02510 [Hornefia porci]
MLSKLADELDVSVSDLLGKDEIPVEETDSLAEQLARINEQLSIKNRRSKRIWKTVIILAIIIFLIIPGLTILGGMYMSANLEGANLGFDGSTEWVYSLDGKEYEYRIEYDKNYKIVSTEGDRYIDDNIDIASCKDANEAGRAIETYFDEHGGEEVGKEVQQLPLKE